MLNLGHINTSVYIIYGCQFWKIERQLFNNIYSNKVKSIHDFTKIYFFKKILVQFWVLTQIIKLSTLLVKDFSNARIHLRKLLENL